MPEIAGFPPKTDWQIWYSFFVPNAVAGQTRGSVLS